MGPLQAIDWRTKPDCSFVLETDINLLKPKADLKLVNGLVLQKINKARVVSFIDSNV